MGCSRICRMHVGGGASARGVWGRNMCARLKQRLKHTLIVKMRGSALVEYHMFLHFLDMFAGYNDATSTFQIS
jgi:hypothetical protein